MAKLPGRLVVILLVLLVTLRLGAMAVRQSYDGPGPLAVTRSVVIPPNGTAAAATVLQQDGAISHRLIFRLAAWLTRRQGHLHAEEFSVPAHASLHQILDLLRFGAPVEHQVTIPEGLTSVQIARILNAATAATGKVQPPPEGAVLPQTYDFVLGTKRADILARAEAAMQTTLQAEWAKRDPNIPLRSPAEAVILASIVQQETPLGTELPQIAAVYENRLRRGMKLQADPTVIFAATNGASSGGASISRANLAAPSPYNTYLFAGLPSGPICAPGRAALNAVLNPAPSDALFFVATGSGGHLFASDFKQQLANIAKYRATLRD